MSKQALCLISLLEEQHDTQPSTATRPRRHNQPSLVTQPRSHNQPSLVTEPHMHIQTHRRFSHIHNYILYILYINRLSHSAHTHSQQAQPLSHIWAATLKPLPLPASQTTHCATHADAQRCTERTETARQTQPHTHRATLSQSRTESHTQRATHQRRATQRAHSATLSHTQPHISQSHTQRATLSQEPHTELHSATEPHTETGSAKSHTQSHIQPLSHMLSQDSSTQPLRPWLCISSISHPPHLRQAAAGKRLHAKNVRQALRPRGKGQRRALGTHLPRKGG